MDVKHIYEQQEALVSDALFAQSDAALNTAFPYSEPGMLIYTAGYKKAKQKSLSGTWVAIDTEKCKFMLLRHLNPKRMR